ncbi:unnamed protein product, partial [Mesorhabditis spiculigera]
MDPTRLVLALSKNVSPPFEDASRFSQYPMEIDYGALVHPAYLEGYFLLFMQIEAILFALMLLTFIPFLIILTTKRFFVWLYFACRRKYYVIYGIKNSTIEGRYNTQTNYKASKTLLRLAPFKVFGSVSVILLYHFGISHSLFVQTFWTFIFFHTVQAQITIQMWLIIFLEPQARRNFLRKFILGAQRHSSPLRTVEGKSLQHHPEVEREIHFRQLEKSWQ